MHIQLHAKQNIVFMTLYFKIFMSKMIQCVQAFILVSYLGLKKNVMMINNEDISYCWGKLVDLVA